ncbi:MAG TPA: F0F1 ATP synthase subunit delta [Casimicrobiaceae bacterium]|jgi:F-type H+-transporting ATPase subunit delta
MAELTTVARPYAEAAFELAREQNALPVWSEMLRFANTVVADPRVMAALENPRLAAGDKEALLLSIAGDRVTGDGRSFLRVLIEADRITLLPQIREVFDLLKDEAENVARAKIESAFPLSREQTAELTAVLEKRFGKKIEATVTINPELIGGARITVGDAVLDASVQAKLDAMSRQLRT